MGNFRSDSGNRGFRGGSSFGGRSGGFSRGEDRGGFGGRREGGFGRGRPEMHEATCAKCEKQCEVPFKPTGERPVLCSDCFRKDGDSGSRGSFGPRRSFDSGESRGGAQSGISSEQFQQLNTKLDKILGILEMIEFEEEDNEETELKEVEQKE